MSLLKHSFKVASSMIVAAVVGFFLCLSINTICLPLFTEVTGYDAFVYTDSTCEKEVTKYVYEYVDDDGDGKPDDKDTKKEEYEDKGYYVVTQKNRSQLKGVGKAVFLISTQVVNAIMVIAFASGSVYKQGFKDKNLVKINHIKYDALKGFKIGLIGNAPFILLFIAACVMALGVLPQFPTGWYIALNSHYYSIVLLITNGATTLSELSVWQFVLLGLLQLIVPVISGIGYIMGFKDINLEEKIVYEKR
ncbi:MAG: hypothetical protein IKU82_06035 [Clostridia bacterium]|nr:hypothetical protein [Clostridia bacterium]